MRYSGTLTGRKTGAKKTPVPQNRPLNNRQVMNNAGGYVYTADSWKQLDRFLILGTEGGTYYVGEQKLTADACKNVLGCIKTDGIKVVNRILEISQRGLAPKQDAGIFALALCLAFGDTDTRRHASSQVSNICRTASTLFQFAEELKGVGVSLSGRTKRRALQSWYQDKSVKDLAYQMVKYQNRNGWGHGDLLRVAHPKGKVESQRDQLYSWAIKGQWPAGWGKPDIIEGFEALKHAESAQVAANLVSSYKLPWECVPTQFRKEAVVWEALMSSNALPLTAMIRNLGNMTTSGYLSPTSQGTKLVNQRLHDSAALKHARIHPINVLIAMKTYQKGSGFKGSNSWTPVQSISASLDDCFYDAFQHATPTGKNLLVAIDVSGSMGMHAPGCANGLLTCAEAAAAMAMYWVRTEEVAVVMGFSSTFKNLGVTSKDSLESALKKTYGMTFGSTDCAQPMLWAAKQKNDRYDAFMVYTDNETWFGSVHPSEALRQYRKTFNPTAALVVSAFAATKFSIADPNDPLSLDIVGFDSSVPQVVSAFLRD